MLNDRGAGILPTPQYGFVAGRIVLLALTITFFCHFRGSKIDPVLGTAYKLCFLTLSSY